jgi:hypothetical protein
MTVLQKTIITIMLENFVIFNMPMSLFCVISKEKQLEKVIGIRQIIIL